MNNPQEPHNPTTALPAYGLPSVARADQVQAGPEASTHDPTRPPRADEIIDGYRRRTRSLGRPAASAARPASTAATAYSTQYPMVYTVAPVVLQSRSNGRLPSW